MAIPLWTDDRAGGKRTEVAAVKAVRDGPIHQEDLAVGDAAATLPVGHRAPEPVGLTRLAHRDPVHRDGSADATDLLSRPAEDAFQEGPAGRQITARGAEARHRRRDIAGAEVGQTRRGS